MIEAKDNKHSIGDGMQQALDYADMLQVPYVFSSNGDGFLFHNSLDTDKIEKEIRLVEFPSPEELWAQLSGIKFTASQCSYFIPPVSHLNEVKELNSRVSSLGFRITLENKIILAKKHLNLL